MIDVLEALTHFLIFQQSVFNPLDRDALEYTAEIHDTIKIFAFLTREYLF